MTPTSTRERAREFVDVGATRIPAFAGTTDGVATAHPASEHRRIEPRPRAGADDVNMQAPMPEIAEPVRGPTMLVAEKVDLYYGAAQALRGVSLRREAGKVTALMGRNGVGKTSFLRAIVGEQPIARGEIRFDGKPLGRIAAARARPPRHRLRAAGPRHLPAPHRAGKPRDRLRAAEARRPHHPAPTSSTCSRCCRACSAAAAAISPAASSSSSPSPAPWSRGRGSWCSTSRPKASSRRSSRTSAAPSLAARQKGDIAILLVEQYFDFVHELADTFAVMDRGQIVLSGTRAEMDPEKVRRHLTV